MSRNKPAAYHAAKKKMKLERLVEKYYGKLALLQAWEGRRDADPAYIRELKVKVRMYKNDLTYRGHDDAGDIPV
jgi:hypothetical protein